MEAYANLMQKAHGVEVLKEKKEAAITRALDNAFPDKANAPTEATYLEEMSAGLFEDPTAEQDEQEVDVDPDAPLTLNPAVRREDKKTITQRNKERRAKERVAQAALLKRQRAAKAEQQLGPKAMRRYVAAVAAERAARAAHRALLRERFRDKPKKLGPNKYEPRALEVKLVEELQPSLHLLAPEGNLMEDRFNNLQQRNMIEPRKRAKRAKTFRPKVFEKKGHKEVS